MNRRGSDGEGHLGQSWSSGGDGKEYNGCTTTSGNVALVDLQLSVVWLHMLGCRGLYNGLLLRLGNPGLLSERILLPQCILGDHYPFFSVFFHHSSPGAARCISITHFFILTMKSRYVQWLCRFLIESDEA